MKKILKIRVLTAVCLIILSLFSVGCGQKAIDTASRVELAKDGTIKAVMTSRFDKDYYDQDELKSSIEMAVDEYNTKNGARRIELKEIRRIDEAVEAVMYYRTATDYASFNNVTFFAGPVTEGLEKDSLPESLALYPAEEGGETVTAADLGAEKNPGSFLVFMEPVRVKVPGKIRYLSEGLTVDEEGYVTVSADKAAGSTLNSLVYVIYK